MTEVAAPQPAAPAPRRRWSMRLLKGLLAAVLAAVILVVGGLSILLLTFDPNQYKATLIQVVQEREHRTLALPGRIELRLFPPLTLRTGPFTLSERDSPAVFARADGLRLHLDLFALLRRKLVVDRVVMTKPQIHVVRNAQGRLNFADLLPENQPGLRPESASARSPLGLSVHRLQVEQGVLVYDDDKGRIHGQLDGIDIGLSGLDGGSAGAFHLQTTARFVQPAAAMGIVLRGRLKADPAQHSLALTDLALSAQGDVPGLTAMQTQISADQLGLSTGSAWALTVRQWRVKTTGRTDGGDTASAQMSLPTLDAKGDILQIGPLDAGADLGAAQPLKVLCKTRQAAGAWSALRVPVAQCDVQRGVSGKPGAMRLTLASPLQLDLAHAHYLLPAVELSGQLAPGARPQTLALQGNAQYDGGEGGQGAKAQFQLQGLVAGSGVKFSGGWAQQGILRLDANADRIDLDDWLPPGAAQPKAAAPVPAPAAIDLSAFQKLGLDAQFDIGSLLYKGMQWRAVQGRLTSDRKTLDLQRFSAQGFGGRVDASLRVDLAQRQYALQQSGRGVSVQPVLQALAGKDFLLGKANWNMNLTAQGKTLPALIASLSGQARLDVRNGAVKGFDLTQMLRNARALLAARKDGRFVAAAGEQTGFTSLGATFVLHDGVAKNGDLAVHSPLLRVGGEGWLDLPRRRLDYLLLPSVVGSPRGMGGADLAALRGVTVPVRVSGSFAQPDCTVLWSQAGSNLLKQTLKNTLEHELQKQLAPDQTELLQKVVPGLFKGLFP